MDYVVGPLHILLAERVGRIWFKLICLKLYQFKRITWWCLCVLEFVLEYVLEFALKFVMLEKLSKRVMIYRNFLSVHVLEVGPTQTPVDHAPLSTTYHVGLHVDFSSMNFSLGLWTFTS